MKDLDQTVDGLRAKDATLAVAMQDALLAHLDALMKACRAGDFCELGRILDEATEHELSEVAAELLANEQDYAQNMDLAEHAEDLGEAFASMLRGLMPVRVA